jgi:hypothetical protein
VVAVCLNVLEMKVTIHVDYDMYSLPPVKRYLYKRNYPLSDYPSVRRNLICWRQQIR